MAITKQKGQIVIVSINGSPLVEPAPPELQVIIDFVRDAPELYAVTHSKDLEQIALLGEGQSTVLKFHVAGSQVTVEKER